LEHANYAFEVDDWTFATLGDILYTMEDQDGINSYIRRSKKDDGQHIVSGNVRAWRELIYYALKSGWTLDVFAPLLVQEDPAKKLLFYSIVEGLGEKVTAYFSKGQEDYTMKLIDWNDPQVANRLSPNDYLVHCPATFRFITDRGVSHEAVRHRPASYAQESTRYCAYSKDKLLMSISQAPLSWTPKSMAWKITALLKFIKSGYWRVRMRNGITCAC
jgi:thymidylate synthase (FAD)